MACQFSIPFDGPASQLISKADEAITRAGGKFSSEGTTGTFELSLPIGKIEGEYSIADSAMTIAIHHKPVFISCSLIEQKIKEYLTA